MSLWSWQEFAKSLLRVCEEFARFLQGVYLYFEFYQGVIARMYLQLPLRQWGAGNVYLLVLSSWKVNIAENPIAVMGLYTDRNNLVKLAIQVKSK